MFSEALIRQCSVIHRLNSHQEAPRDSRLVTRNREIPRDLSARLSCANDFCRVVPKIT